MQEHAYFTSISMLFGTVLLVVGIIAWAFVQRARASSAHGEAYQRLAEKAAAVQTDAAASLAAIQASLDDVKARLAGIEKVLKEVG
jgi:predicted negative regulator of RcsB-dependent stress response